MKRTICMAALLAQGSAHGARFDDIPALQQKLKMFIENPSPNVEQEKQALQVGEQPAMKQQEPADVSYKFSSSKRVLAEDGSDLPSPLAEDGSDLPSPLAEDGSDLPSPSPADATLEAENGDAETADISPSPAELDKAAADAAEKAAADAAAEKAAAEKAAADAQAEIEAAEKATAEAQAEADALMKAASETEAAAQAAERAAAEAEDQYREEEQRRENMNPQDFLREAMKMVTGYDGRMEDCPFGKDFTCKEIVPSGEGCCADIQISDMKTGNQDMLMMCIDTMYVDGSAEFELMDKRVTMYCTEDFKSGSTYLTSAFMASLAALVSMTVF